MKRQGNFRNGTGIRIAIIVTSVHCQNLIGNHYIGDIGLNEGKQKKMGTFKIYDWSGQEFVHPIRGKIEAITISVISGDEVVYIVYADGTTDNFDAGEDTVRMMNFYDGSYRLTDPDDIERWLKFDPAESLEKRAGSYQRKDEFTEKED